MVRSNDYYRAPVDHGTWLYACDDGEQIVGRAPDVVPHYDFGKQPYAREYSERHKLPLGVAWTGVPSMYPGYADTAKNMTDAQGIALLSPAAGRPNETSKAIDPEPRDGEIHVLPIRENVYMLTGSGGKLGASVGEDGIDIVDDQFAPLAPKIQAALKQLSPQPVRFVINTHWHGDHTGGNAVFAETAAIMAHANVRKRLMTGGKTTFIEFPPVSGKALPVVTGDRLVLALVRGDDMLSPEKLETHFQGAFRPATARPGNGSSRRSWPPPNTASGCSRPSSGRFRA